MIGRRKLLAAPLLAGATLSARQAAAGDAGLRRGLADLERRHGGRLGVAILDTATGRLAAHRGDERFPLCSTYKFLAAACVLARVDRGQESLARRVVIRKRDLVTYSPVTGKHVGGEGLTVGEICEAAVTLSDNAAGNLLLDRVGGPAGLTAWLRTLGDRVTRLDRRETALNEVPPGDPRDTTTPVAMLGVLRRTVLGTALSPASREQLSAWLLADKVGDQRLRAGLPPGWRIGDKTGSGADNATNDVAVIWPSGRAPVLVAVYYIGSRGTDAERNAVVADVGRLAAAV